MKVKLLLNGRERIFSVHANEYLLDTLRNHNILSVKKGCDASTCGVCTVLKDGKPILSCSMLTARCEGANITTVEGLQDEVNKFYEYFGQEGADQCGFCNPATALTVIAMKKHLKDPNPESILSYMVGNLCRCSGYVAQNKAIKKYLEDKS